jgi:beta-alanine degradation protein BauB
MRRSVHLAIGIVLGAFAVSAAGRVTTQDPVKVSPQYYTVRFENDRVRVLEYWLKPGEKEATHSHPPGVVYVLGDATIRSVRPDGTSSETAGKAGEVFWRDDTTHAVENVGATDARAIAIELKPCAR